MTNRNSKSNRKATAWLTALVVILMIACVGVGLIGYYSAGFSDWSQFEAAFGVDKQPADEDLNTNGAVANGFNTVITNSERVLLAVSAATTAAESNTVSKTLTATVLPEDVPDKSVDWSVAWSVPLEGEPDVTDYVTVTPQSDGSNIATVTAHQGFEGASIYITVTTRVGGFSAVCLVTYDGAPETSILTISGYEPEYDSTAGVNIYSLEAGARKDYTVNLNMSNTLGAVGSKYNALSHSLQFEFFGKIVYKFTPTNSAESTEVTIDLNLLHDNRGGENIDYLFERRLAQGIFGSNVILMDGTSAVLSLEKSFASITLDFRYSGNEATVGGVTLARGTYEFVRYADENNLPYIAVHGFTSGIIDSKHISIIGQDIFIRPVSAVTGVSMSDSVITF